MSDAVKNQQAFPIAFETSDGFNGTRVHLQLGMTLRDAFAMKAMQGAIATSGGPWLSKDAACAASVAAMAYQVADAMLLERAK